MQLNGSMYLMLAIMASAAMTIVLKIFKTGNHNRYAIILGNYITCIVTGFLMLSDKSVIVRGTPVTYVCGGIGGVLFVVTLVLMQKSIESNGAILTAAFSKLGLIVPLFLSVAFFGEKPGVLQIVGVCVVLAAILVINGKKGETKVSAPLILILVLFATGITDSMAKVFDRVGSRDQDSLYILFVFFTALLLTTCLFFNEQIKKQKKSTLKDFLAGIAVGIPNYFSSLLLLKSLSALPAFIVYTCFSTGALILVSIVSLTFFKERPTARQVIGLVMVLAALVILNL